MHEILILSGVYNISILIYEHMHVVHISMNGHEIVYEKRKNCKNTGCGSGYICVNGKDKLSFHICVEM